jgi:hypothetical protein
VESQPPFLPTHWSQGAGCLCLLLRAAGTFGSSEGPCLPSCLSTFSPKLSYFPQQSGVSPALGLLASQPGHFVLVPFWHLWASDNPTYPSKWLGASCFGLSLCHVKVGSWFSSLSPSSSLTILCLIQCCFLKAGNDRRKDRCVQEAQPLGTERRRLSKR